MRVDVDVDITRILLIDEVQGIFEVQQFVNLSWLDPRITFHNLKHKDYQNSLLESEKQMIWIPTITFLNTADQVFKIKLFKNLNFELVVKRSKACETTSP